MTNEAEAAAVACGRSWTKGIRAVTMHAAVSRGMAAGCPAPTPGVARLIRLRRALRDVGQHVRNALADGVVPTPSRPDIAKALRETLAAGGLPEDLETLVREALARRLRRATR